MYKICFLVDLPYCESTQIHPNFASSKRLCECKIFPAYFLYNHLLYLKTLLYMVQNELVNLCHRHWRNTRSVIGGQQYLVHVIYYSQQFVRSSFFTSPNKPSTILFHVVYAYQKYIHLHIYLLF